ncbi:unnamed protein product [Taenia asiatica]|uniref:Separase n=1 Tax=Taenia asiatica TaxID=60517 RepID=A0A0R3VUT2_TAEAS|nr:unnamed protein product [Taenia asiatica]
MDIPDDICESSGMDDDLSTVKSLSVLRCSYNSKKSTIFEGLVDSDLKTGNEFALIQIKLKKIEKQLLQKKPAQAVQMLIEVLDDLNDFSECDTYSLWEKLYLYFSKAYEQTEDWESVAHCLDMAIKSVERRLSHSNAEACTNCSSETKKLLAELCKRYAITLECLNEDTKAVAVAWIKVEKAFEDCDSSRDACFSALRAVRWFITAADLDSALSALSIALNMVKLVEEMSDRGMVMRLRFNLISCFNLAFFNFFSTSGVMDNRAGKAQAHCNLGYALMCTGKHKLSHWHYTLARDLAKETAWETVQIQAEGALNVLETPNFPRNSINSSPVISICPSMARLRCQGDNETPSLSSPPSAKANGKEKKGQGRVREDKEKQKTEQITTILHTSSSFTKSLHSEDDICLPTGRTLSLRKMNDVQSTADRDRQLIRGVMSRKKYTRIHDISSLKPLGNPNSHGDQGDDSLEEIVFKPVTTATLSRLRRTPFTMSSK